MNFFLSFEHGENIIEALWFVIYKEINFEFHKGNSEIASNPIETNQALPNI